MMPVGLKTITNSSRCTFLDCQYKFFCEYILRLTPKTEPVYFIWGRLVHRYAEGVDHELTTDRILAEMYDELEIEITEKCYSQKQVSLIEGMIKILPNVFTGWQLRWHHENKKYETLGVEYKFSLPLPNGTLFQGKIDRLVREVATGDYWVWERKTAKMVDDNYINAIQLDSQPKGYALAAQRAIGVPVKGVIYDLFLKPQIRQRKVENEDQFNERLGNTYVVEHKKYFARYRFPFKQADIDAYYYDIAVVAETIEHHMIEGIWSKHHPKNRIGGCTYFALCCEQSTCGPAMMRFNVRDVKNAHPELDDEQEVNVSS